MPTNPAAYSSDAESTTENMPTVYLIAQPTVSTKGELPKLEPLGEWGRVKVLVQPGEDPRFNPQLALERIRSRLADFDPSVDFLAWAGGDTLAAVLVGSVLADFATDETEPFESFKWLRFERARTSTGQRTDVGGKYVPISVPLFSANGDTFEDPSDDPDEISPTTEQDA